MEHISRTIARYRRQLACRMKVHNGKPRGCPVKSVTKEKSQ